MFPKSFLNLSLSSFLSVIISVLGLKFSTSPVIALLKPLAKIVSWASVGVDPTLMGLGPIEE